MFSARPATARSGLAIQDSRCHLLQTVNKLLHRKLASSLPSSTWSTSLAVSFTSFFTHKISKFCLPVAVLSTTASSHLPYFFNFRPASESDISRILFISFIGSGSFKIIENGIIWEIAYEFLFIFHCIYGHILYCFRNKARHLLQNAYFSKLPSI